MQNSHNHLEYSKQTSWHKDSYDRFLNSNLPNLLCENFPVTNYNFTKNNDQTGSIELTITSASGEVTITYDNIPYPTPAGIFTINRQNIIVSPVKPKSIPH